MKPTGRGYRVFAVTVLVLGAGLLFLDPFLLIASALGAFVLLYDAVDGFRVSRRPSLFGFEPNSVDGRILRGDSRRFAVTLKTPRSLAFDTSATGWMRFDATAFGAGSWPAGLELASDLAGKYHSEGVPADMLSRYGLYSSRVLVPLEVTLRVYPRLVAAALAALEYLTRVGTGMEGEAEKNLLGPGLEYAETREYMPGDSLRRVDWKATARSSSLMIKHYFTEGGGALHVIYFVEAPGPRTHDEMATQLLELVVSSAVRVTPISVTAYQKGMRLTTFEGNGWEVVISTLNLVMAQSGITYDDLYSVLDIVSLSKERRSLILAGRGRLAELLRKGGGKRQALVADFRGLVAHLASPDVISSFVILSSLVSNRDVLAEIIEDLRFRRAETTVVYPKKPWLDATNLAEAYVLKSSQEKMLSFAGSAGALMGGIPLKIPRMTGIPSWAVSAAA